MTTWYTSDHHYNHKNIIEYAERPFTSMEEHNEALLERYNSKVQPEDTVFFLGDVFFSDKIWAAGAMERLKGHKHLVMGNHDRMSVTKFKSMGFEEVYRKQVFMHIAGRECLLSHYPLPPDTPNLGTTEFYLHGHVHTRNKRVGRNIHVGVDAWDYCPASDEELGQLMDEFDREGGT